MNKEAILKLCKQHKLYITPKLNDVLYLHYQGFNKIECLEKYTGLKCLWLNNNAITRISGLDRQEELRCLYLQNNFIQKLENLESCLKLDTLNLSHNYIRTIDNCDSSILPALNTLNLSHNALGPIEGLQGLVNCKTLSILDLSHNRIDDILLVKYLARMPELRVLTLTGNPVINEIPAYRKTLIIECKNLTYLDNRPVFDRDKACAEAWKKGGLQGEKEEHEKWVKAKQRKILSCVRTTLRLEEPAGLDRDILDEVETDSAEENDDERSKEQLIVNETDATAFEKAKHEITENGIKTNTETLGIDFPAIERVRDASETAIVDEELTPSDKISKENLSEEEEELNASAHSVSTEFSNNLAVSSTKLSSSVIFHCKDLDSLI